MELVVGPANGQGRIVVVKCGGPYAGGLLCGSEGQRLGPSARGRHTWCAITALDRVGSSALH
jgi:hypothetical protein